MSDIDSDIDYEDDELIQKQDLFQEEIVNKNYDKTDFIYFCLFKKENGGYLNEWTLEELKNIIHEFQESQALSGDSSQDNWLEDLSQDNWLEDLSQNDNINKLILKIFVQSNGYLDNKNFYLISYFRGKNEKIKYTKNCSFNMSLI